MYLSKSIYVNVWRCPKGAWINKYHPEWVVVSEDQQARFDTGHEVGDPAHVGQWGRVCLSRFCSGQDKEKGNRF